MPMTKILALNGSLRKDSWNGKLLDAFLGELSKSEYSIQKKNLDLPLVNEDLEKTQLPQIILEFRAALKECPIIVLASPEYNGSYTPAMKNAIDWGTRPPENLWAGKIAIMLSASPGGFAGIRGQIQLRTLLSGIKTWVLPEQVLLPMADKAFTPDGKLTNDMVKAQIKSAIESLNSFAKKMLI